MKKQILILFTFLSVLSLKAQDIIADFIVTPTTCNIVDNAEITISASGGDGNYVYAAVPSGSAVTPADFTTINIIFNLVPDVYDVYIRDNGGAVNYNEVVNVVIIEPASRIDFSTVLINPTSCSGDLASVEVTVSSGVGPYNIQIVDAAVGIPVAQTTGATANTVFTDLQAGDYLIYVNSEVNECASSQTLIIDDTELLVDISTVAAASCNDTGATIQINAFGGIPPYEYSIDGGVTWSNSSIFENLNEGSVHEVIVRDDYFCTLLYGMYTVPYTIALESISTVTGSNEIAVTAIGGTPPYMFSLIDPTGTVVVEQPSTAATFIFTDLSVGAYQTLSTDANGCNFTSNIIEIVEVNDPAATDDFSLTNSNESVIIGVLDNDLFVQETGTITVSDPQNGTVIINDSGTPNNITDDTITYTPTIDYVGEDSFEYTLCDNMGNCDIATVNINVEAVTESLAFTITSSDVSCNGITDGSITVNVTQGDGPYRYRLIELIELNTGVSSILADVTVDEPTYLFENLAVADYEIQVIIPNTPYGSEIITIQEPEVLNVSASITEEIGCLNDLATVTVEGIGGTPPYEFTIDGGVTWQTSTEFSNLSEGNYTIGIKDANNCTACSTVSNVLENGSFEDVVLTNGFEILDESEVSGWETTAADNVIEVWSDGFQNVPAYEGDNFIEINGNSGAILYQEFSTNPGDIIEWSLAHRGRNGVDAANISIGGSLGLVTVEEVMSTDNTAWEVYTGTYIVPEGQTTTVIAFEAVSSASGNLSVGNFIDDVSLEIIESDQNTCQETITIDAVAYPELVADVYANNTTCGNTEDGVVSVIATGGTGIYTYELLSEEGVLLRPAQTYETFVELAAGNYVINVTSGDCLAVTNIVTILEPLPIEATLNIESITCNGSSDGSIIVNATGGIPPYLYSTNNSTVFQESNIFENLSADTYTISVQDSYGCIFYTETIQLVEPAPVVVNSINVLPSGNEASGNIILGASGGIGGYSYSINGGPFTNSNEFFGLTAGDYIIDVADANLCLANSFTVTIAQLNIDNSIAARSEGGLTANFKEAISYQWINAETGVRIPEATNVDFVPSEYGDYQVEMLVDDGITVAARGAQIASTSQTVLSPIINYSSGVLGIEGELLDTFTVYPNPATSFINVPGDLFNESYIIYDLLGKQVSKGIITSPTLQLRDLSKGIYYLKVSSYKTVKFIKE